MANAKPDALDKIRKDIIDALYITGGIVIIGGVVYIGYEYYQCKQSGNSVGGCIMDKVSDTVSDSYTDGILQYSGIGIGKKLYDAISSWINGNKDKDKQQGPPPDPTGPQYDECKALMQSGQLVIYNGTTKKCDPMSNELIRKLFGPVLDSKNLLAFRQACDKIGFNAEKELVHGLIWARYGDRGDGTTSNLCAFFRLDLLDSPKVEIGGVKQKIDGHNSVLPN